jgi:hypothetical protein
MQPKSSVAAPLHSRNVLQSHTISNIVPNAVSSSSSSSSSSGGGGGGLREERHSLHPKPQRHLHDPSKKPQDKQVDADSRAQSVGGAIGGALLPVVSSNGSSCSSRAFTERLAAKVQEVGHHAAPVAAHSCDSSRSKLQN